MKEKFKVCHSDEVEDEMHLIFDCSIYDSERVVFMGKIQETCKNFSELNKRNKFIWLLSNEDDNVISLLSNYIFLLYGSSEKCSKCTYTTVVSIYCIDHVVCVSDLMFQIVILIPLRFEYGIYSCMHLLFVCFYICCNIVYMCRVAIQNQQSVFFLSIFYVIYISSDVP